LSIKKNIVANVIGTLLPSVAGFLFVPIYVKYLGVESYGLVGLLATFQALALMLDFGLGATIRREMAKLQAIGDSVGMSTVLRTFEYAYMALTVVVLVSGLGLGAIFGTHWLFARSLDPSTVQTVLRIMCMIVALQLLLSLYQGGLMGLSRQVEANTVTVTFGMIRGFGSCLMLWKFTQSIEWFFLLQLGMTVLQVVATRHMIWSCINARARTADWSVFRVFWRYSASMMLASVLSAALSQSDRLIVSSRIGLEAFGYYSLAGIVAQSPSLLILPIQSAVFPRLVALVSLRDRTRLVEFVHLTSQAISIISAAMACTLVLFCHDLVYAWTRNAAVTVGVSRVAPILTIGCALLSLQIIPYLLQLAYGWTRIIVISGIVTVCILVPGLWFLTGAFGVTGAAYGWLIMNAGTFVVVTPFVLRKFMAGEVLTWFCWDVAVPIFAVLCAYTVLHWLIPGGLSIGLHLAGALCATLISVVVGVMFAADLRGKAILWANALAV
jgi:O-antigen/teichoic acid export membrane protein